MNNPHRLLFSFCFIAALANGQTPALKTIATAPQAFEPNQGQADRPIDFTSRGPGYALSLTAGSADLQLVSAEPARQNAAIRLKWVGADPNARPEGVDLQAGKSNYFVGRDSKQWRTDIPQYGRVRYHGVYPGIDVAYYGNNQRLEYDFILAPHADPRQIRLAVEGADRLRIDATGDLVLTVGSAEIRERKPVIYQDTASGRHIIEGRYTALGGNQAGFALGRYDSEKPLIIDPVLVFSTYFGKTTGDQGLGVTLDSAGNIYLCGMAGAGSFNGTNIGTPVFSGTNQEAFVAKFSPAGALLFSTFIAGTNDQALATGIALDAAGNIYLTGDTSATTFPTTAGAFQRTYGGAGDAFALELNAAGNALVYSTFLGGNALDATNGIGVDANGNALVSGWTQSRNFPVVNATQPALGGAASAFAVKIAPGGASLVYSTYFGGSAGGTYNNGIAVDSSGDLFFFGSTSSTNLPMLNAFQPNFCGWTQGQSVSNLHGWVAKLSPTGSPVFSSFVCGSVAGDVVRAATTDAAGNLIMTGVTSSTTYPTLSPLQAAYGGGGSDAFVTKLSPTGTLLYSTYLGGSAAEVGRGVGVDQLGNIYVTGNTNSTNFPTTANGTQRTLGGSNDAFLTKINAAGSPMAFSTYLGGSSDEYGWAVVADSLANAYIAGWTTSANFPSVAAAQPAYGGGSSDAFLTAISTCSLAFSSPGNFAMAGGSGSVTVTTTAECGWSATTSTPWITITSSPATGAGTGSVAFSVTANSGASRQGNLTINGQNVAVTQDGQTAVFSVSETNAASFTQGQTGATYTATVTNGAAAGPTSGTVSLTQSLPAGLTLVSMSGPGWSCPGAVCSRSDVLAAGASYPAVTVTVNVAANASSPLVAQVSVSGGGASAAATATDSTTIIAAPLLNVSETNAASFTQGQNGAAYTVTVGNGASAGPTSGTVTLTQNLPSGLSLVSMTGAGWSCTGASCTRSDSLGTGATYPAITVTVNVAANAGSPLAAQVSVSGGGSPTATATDNTTVVAVPVLTVSETNAAGFTQGQNGAVYTVVVGNGAGAGPVSGTITLTQTLASGLTLVSMSGTGWACSGAVCTRSDALAAGASYPAVTVTVNVAANAGSPLAAQVSVSGGGALSSATSTDNTTIAPAASPALSVSETHAGSFTQGQMGATYTATVGNGSAAGPTTGAVTLSETLPAGLTLVSMAGSGWSCAGASCTRSDVLNAGASYPAVIVTVNVAANAGSPLAAQASVSGGGSATASATDNTTIIPLPVLSVSETHAGNFTQGQTGATYSVSVSNGASAGPTSGTVTLTQSLPAGLTLTSMAGSGWSCAGASCSRSDALNAGASYPAVIVTVNVAANAGSPLAAQASVSGGGSATASATDNTTIIPLPVLSVSEMHAGNFTQGQTGATYSVSVSNGASAGPTSGTVTLTQTLPAGLTLTSMAGSGWSCAGASCSRGDALNAGAAYPAVTVTVNVASNAGSPLATQVSVSGGGSATATGTDSATVISLAGLSVSETHSGNFTQGQTGATYTVSVSNGASAGPTSGTVTLTQSLPAGLTLTSMAGSGWSCAGASCSRSDALNAGASYPAVTVTVNVASNAGSPLATQVSVSGGGSATATGTDSTTVISLAGLSVTETHSGNFTQGQTGATYIVSVSNGASAGPTSGTVTLTQILPAGLTLTSMAGSGWSCGGASCSRSDALNAGAAYPAVTVTVNVASNAGSPLATQVSVSGGGSATATGADSVIVGAASIPALTVSETHSGNFTQGQTGAAYTVVVGNGAAAGPTAGTVTLTQTLPAGLTLATMSGAGWSCSGATCTRSDSLAGGATYPTVTVTVNVASNAASSLTAQVSVSGGGSATAGATDVTTIQQGSTILTLTNQGPIAMSYGGLQVIGTSGTQTNNCPANVLPVNATCNITMSFGGGASAIITEPDWAGFSAYASANQQLIAGNPDPTRIVFMGDSVTLYWDKASPYGAGSLQSVRPFINRGLAGQTTEEFLVRFREDVIKLNPAAVHILGGTNDLGANTGAMTNAQIMDQIISMAEIAKANNIKVLIASITPVVDFAGNVWSVRRPTATIRALNQLIQTYCQQVGAVYVDYFSVLADANGNMKTNLTVDGLHPNTAGYQAMVPVAQQALQLALGY